MFYRDITWEYKGKEITSDTQNNRYKRTIDNTALSIEIFGRKPKLREDNTTNNKSPDLELVNNKSRITNIVLGDQDSFLRHHMYPKGNITVKSNIRDYRNFNLTKTENVRDIIEQISKTRVKRDATVSNDGILTITKVSKVDNGLTYSCIVKSPSGEMAKRTFELQIVEAPQLEELMMGSDLQEGQIVQIHCNLKSGDSPVYYSWLKDGKKIPSHLKVSFQKLLDSNLSTLVKIGLNHTLTKYALVFSFFMYN